METGTRNSLFVGRYLHRPRPFRVDGWPGLSIVMRFSFVISMLAGTVACANPVLLPPALKAYIASEKVVISITPTNAAFTATFTFRSDAEAALMAGTSSPPASVDLPIWFPEDRIGNTTVARFWAAFEKDAWNR